MEDRLSDVRVVQSEWMRRLTTTGSVWSHGESINALFLLLHIVEAGPVAFENAVDFNSRIQTCYQHYLDERNVVGRLQEKCKSRNDAGDDEDG